MTELANLIRSGSLEPLRLEFICLPDTMPILDGGQVGFGEGQALTIDLLFPGELFVSLRYMVGFVAKCSLYPKKV